MKRRQFVFTTATFALLTGCGLLPNLGKPATTRVARVGILAADANNVVEIAIIAGLKQGLAGLGYLDGQTIVFELRDADSNFAQLPDLANELVQLPVDVLVTVGGAPPTLASRQATTVVPVVFANVNDPVGQGLVASLDHPSGNATGVTTSPPTVYGKLVEFLDRLVPRLSRVAFFTNLNPALSAGGILGPSGVDLTTTAANTLGVQLKFLDVRSAQDVEPALAEALAWQPQAMIYYGPGPITDATPRLVNFQLQNRVPLATTSPEVVPGGVLVSYGASNYGHGRQAATIVNKVLKGARPADLPVEQPSVYDLAVNQTTAKALGIAIPPEVAQQVTQWVQ